MGTPTSELGLLRRPSLRLTFDDAEEVWKRRFLGESEHRIAQTFGVSQARISEILKEKRHVGSRAVALGNLGRLLTARASRH